MNIQVNIYTLTSTNSHKQDALSNLEVGPSLVSATTNENGSCQKYQSDFG